MKKVLFISILLCGSFFEARSQSMCDEVAFYFQQLAINCRNIAGRVIPSVKEHVTTKVIAGMDHGQCSGTQAYTNDFVKFYSRKYDTPNFSDTLYQHFKAQLSACATADGYSIQSQAIIDDGDKMIRWNKTADKTSKTIVLEMKPDAEAGFVVTLEFILSKI